MLADKRREVPGSQFPVPRWDLFLSKGKFIIPTGNRELRTVNSTLIMNRAIAVKLQTGLAPGALPDSSDWGKAPTTTFSSDWRGENADPQRETKVQLLWSYERLFVRFCCRFREIGVYPGGAVRRDQLWLRDVAELFIRPGAEEPGHYREFEISPNGDWLDLDICHGQKTHLFCSLTCRAIVQPDSGIWIAELAIPMNCITTEFHPEEIWRLNLFRIEGPEPNRFYSAWQPTHTPQPNFHVPNKFGELQFAF